MADAEFVFKIVEEGGAGGTGTAAGKGGDPMASPQPSARTQVREESQAQAGGAPEIVQDAQRKTRDEERKRPKPKPAEPKPDPVQEEAQVGGAAEVVEEAQRKRRDQEQKRPKPKPPEPKPDPFGAREQAKLFGQAIAQRFGLGGVAKALGTAALPVALGTAAVAAGVGVARLQAAAAQRLRPFSADLAASGARETARQTLENLEQARRFGAQLAESERQRGRLGAATSRFGTGFAAGPIGQEIGAITELGSRAVEAASAVQENETLRNIIVSLFRKSLPGPELPFLPSDVNRALDTFGIGRDRLSSFEGNLPLFQDFPHAVVNVVPDGMVQPRFDGRNNASQFTTDQDRILDQF